MMSHIILFILPQILLVTGGYDDNYLDSTEVLRPASGCQEITSASGWQEITSARLPRPMAGVRVSTVNNRVLLFGEWSGDR